MKTKNFLDSFVGYLLPRAGLNRARARASQDLLDQYMQERQHDAASRGRRTQNWKARSTSANNEIERDIILLRDRSRDMRRNNRLYANGIRTIANNTVGTGIVPTPEDGRNFEKVRKLWKHWANKSTCDYDGVSSFYGLQRLIMEAVAESGEVIVRKRRVRDDKKCPIKLQVVESDYLDIHKTSIGTEKGGYIVNGVQFDASDRKIGYWLYDYHPSEGMVAASRFVPASDVLHIYRRDRPGQVRGVPLGQVSILALKDYDDYEGTELVKQKTAACFAGFVTRADADAVVGAKEQVELASRMEPGMIEVLQPGQTIEFANPPSVNSFDKFARGTLMGSAAGMGVTYESMTGDLSGVNFSSGRMGWLEMARTISDYQWNIMVTMFCEPVWQWFIDALDIAGANVGEVDAEWTIPRREMLDPVKETKAMSEAVRNGFTTWSEIVRMWGYDPRDVLKELQKDREAFDKAGLELTSDPRYDAGKSKDLQEAGKAPKPKAKKAPKK